MNSTNQQAITYKLYSIRPSIAICSNSTQKLQTPLIRSIRMIKRNQNTEQKRQYLERVLRMAQQHQQRLISNSSAFDRLRFSNQSNVTTVTPTEKPVENTNQTDSDDDVIIESVVPKSSGLQSWSGFLIDNCDEPQSSSISHSTVTLPTTSSTIDTSVNKTNDDSQSTQNTVLINELNTADIQQKQVLKHHKLILKRLQRKNSSIHSQTTTEQTDNKKLTIESPSNEIIEQDSMKNSNDLLSQLMDKVEKTSTICNDADKRVQINLLLEQIKKQQMQLKNLSQYVSSMLDDTHEQTDNINQSQDILTNFVNQPLTSGCWLCSGKTYTEVAIQCNSVDE